MVIITFIVEALELFVLLILIPEPEFPYIMFPLIVLTDTPSYKDMPFIRLSEMTFPVSIAPQLELDIYIPDFADDKIEFLYTTTRQAREVYIP